MKRLHAGIVLVSILALTGCGASYSSPEALEQAYVDAGGACKAPAEIPESMLSEGAHGVLCGPPMTFLIVFDSSEAKDRYLARTGDSELISYGGDRWIASSEESDIVSQLGGSEISR